MAAASEFELNDRVYDAIVSATPGTVTDISSGTYPGFPIEVTFDDLGVGKELYYDVEGLLQGSKNIITTLSFDPFSLSGYRNTKPTVFTEDELVWFKVVETDEEWDAGFFVNVPEGQPSKYTIRRQDGEEVIADIAFAYADRPFA